MIQRGEKKTGKKGGNSERGDGEWSSIDGEWSSFDGEWSSIDGEWSSTDIESSMDNVWMIQKNKKHNDREE
jgi:hypothetical protein